MVPVACPGWVVVPTKTLLLDRHLEGGNLGYRLLKGLQLKYYMPLEKVQAASTVHAPNVVVMSLLTLVCVL